jgi:hypothetical protein
MCTIVLTPSCMLVLCGRERERERERCVMLLVSICVSIVVQVSNSPILIVLFHISISAMNMQLINYDGMVFGGGCSEHEVQKRNRRYYEERIKTGRLDCLRGRLRAEDCEGPIELCQCCGVNSPSCRKHIHKKNNMRFCSKFCALLHQQPPTPPEVEDCILCGKGKDGKGDGKGKAWNESDKAGGGGTGGGIDGMGAPPGTSSHIIFLGLCPL